MQTRLFLCLVLLALALAGCGGPREAEGPAADETALADEGAEVAEEPTPVPTAAATASPLPQPTPTDGPVKEVYAVGDTARLDPFRIALNEVSTATKTELGEPQPGNEFLLLNVTVTNTGDESRDVAVLTQMVLEDPASGKLYAVDPGASFEAITTINGTLKGQETATGTLGYQVPAGASGLRFIFRTATADGTSEAARVTFGL